jgi:hypothetical protein
MSTKVVLKSTIKMNGEPSVIYSGIYEMHASFAECLDMRTLGAHRVMGILVKVLLGVESWSATWLVQEMNHLLVCAIVRDGEVPGAAMPMTYLLRVKCILPN